MTTAFFVTIAAALVLLWWHSVGTGLRTVLEVQGLPYDARKARRGNIAVWAAVLVTAGILLIPKDAFQKPATRVHTDFSPNSARQLFEESWDQDKPKEEGLKEAAELIRQSVDCPNAADRKYKRVMAVNVWRPLTKPPHDYPLAFVTRDTLPEADVRHADFIEEQKEGYTYFGELSLCEYNPNHQWYCFSEMTPDEVVLFVGYDFNRPGSTGVMHAAFPDPAWTKHNHGRASVEVRVFALWEN